MKVAVCTTYGDADMVRIIERPAPVPKPRDVLIRTRATTVSSGDARLRSARFPQGFSIIARLIFGLKRPRQPVFGTELSGTIEAVGRDVTRFKVGDPVFAFTGARMGAHAELVCLPEDGAIAAMPKGFSFEEAAAISFGGTTALYFLRDLAKIKEGERLLVNGASGTVGLAAVQIAKHYGAHVTGVCSGANAALVRSVGADAVIDYTTTDFADGTTRSDIIMDTVGNLTLARCKAALNPRGRLLLVVASLGDMLRAPIQSMTSGFRVAASPAPDRAEDIADLKRLCDEGHYRPIIDSSFPFERIADAHARVDTGRKRGSVVVTLP